MRVHVIDSHTEGEPTRVVVDGHPNLGTGSLAERLHRFCTEFDSVRAGIVLEPRGHEAIVGAVLVEPVDPTADFGVLYFNNAGPLGMCGHGTIGVVRTLEWLGKLKSSTVRIETPVGVVSATIGEGGSVTIENVPSYRSHSNLTVDVPGYGSVTGDIAYGGNWFFLAHSPVPIEPSAIGELTKASWAIRHALEAAGHMDVDHIELYGDSPVADARNFVLCPGGAYDRSPCGTGTSAKLACLHSDGAIKDGEVFRIESVIGGIFEGSIRQEANGLIPTITGRAFVTAEAMLLFDPQDPFVGGIPS